jgi:hypothetical protein
MAFTVYAQNTTTNAYYSVYTTTQNNPAQTGSIDYTVLDQNATYLLRTTVVKNGQTYTYGGWINPQYWNPGNQPLGRLINLPTGLFGYSSIDATTLGMSFLVTMTAMMFGAISFGFGMLMTIAVIGAAFTLGLSPFMTWGLLIFMIGVGLIDTYGSKRK